MINELLDLLGYSNLDALPFFGEELMFLFILVSLFFGALAFFDALLKIIFGILPRR